MSYIYRTQTDGIISAKSPMWLGLASEIPNDVNLIIDKLAEAKVL